jgi:hypothetical protein
MHSLPVLLVLATLYSVVDIASRTLGPALARFREARDLGLGVLDAARVVGMPAIAGGATLTQAPLTGAHIISESNGKLSRDEITIASGQDLVAGRVLGRITATGKYIGFDEDAVDGSQTPRGVLWAAVDATDGDAAGVIHNLNCEVLTTALTWDAGTTAGEQATALATLLTLGIKAR